MINIKKEDNPPKNPSTSSASKKPVWPLFTDPRVEMFLKADSQLEARLEITAMQLRHYGMGSLPVLKETADVSVPPAI